MKMVVFLSVLSMFCCCKSSTLITDSRVVHDEHPIVYSDILVVALVDKNRSYLEKAVEENVVNSIREKGYNASSYYSLYGPATQGKYDEPAIAQLLKNNTGSAILTITLLDTTHKDRFISSDVNYDVLDQANTRFIGYFTAPYEPSYSKRYIPGYIDNEIKYYWQTKLYTSVTGEVAYSSITEVRDHGSSDELAAAYSRATVKDMRQNDVFMSPRARRQRQSSQSRIARNY